jgi:hypothetical protein
MSTPDDQARALHRLAGGVTPQERDLLLGQLNEHRDPLIARDFKTSKRPEVFARFALFAFAEAEPRARPGLYGGWFVSGYLSRNGEDRAIVTDLTIEPAENATAEITSPVLRSLRVAEIRAKALNLLDRPDPELEQRARAAAAAAAATPLQRGASGYPADHFRRVAFDYLDLFQAQGMTRGILDELAERYQRPRATVRDWINRARELGFLTKGRRGGAGAEAGPNLYTTEDER